MKRFVLLLGVLLVFGSTISVAEALPILANGDFESGNFGSGGFGWTTFTTTHGVIDPVFPSALADPFPRVDLFDVNGDGLESKAALFMVGVDPGNPLVFEGGGISQDFTVSTADAGDLSISLDIAVNGTGNGSGGKFDLLVDDTSISSHNFFSILVGTPVERASLFGTVNLSAGDHTLSILMQRPYHNIGGQTPIQYLDNLQFVAGGNLGSGSSTGLSSGSGSGAGSGSATGSGAGSGSGSDNDSEDELDENGFSSVPEPSIVALLGSGLLGMFFWKRKKTRI